MAIPQQIGEEQEEGIAVPHHLPFGEPWERADPMDQYRFDWDEINVMADALELPEVFVLDNGSVASKIQGLCVVLHRLSFPRRFTDAAAFFGRSKSVMSRIFNQVADTIYQSDSAQYLADNCVPLHIYSDNQESGSNLRWGYVESDDEPLLGSHHDGHQSVCRNLG